MGKSRRTGKRIRKAGSTGKAPVRDSSARGATKCVRRQTFLPSPVSPPTALLPAMSPAAPQAPVASGSAGSATSLALATTPFAAPTSTAVMHELVLETREVRVPAGPTPMLPPPTMTLTTTTSPRPIPPEPNEAPPPFLATTPAPVATADASTTNSPPTTALPFATTNAPAKATMPPDSHRRVESTATGTVTRSAQQSSLAVVAPLSHPELIVEWLRGKAPTTLLAYRRDLLDFAAHLRVASMDEAARLLLSGGHADANRILLGYKNALMEREVRASRNTAASTRNESKTTLASATVARRLAAVRSLVALARTLGLVEWSIDIKSPRVEPVRDTRGPGRQAVRAMTAELEKRDGRKAVRDRAILRLLHDRALRRSELVSLDLEHVDLERGEISVLGKGRRAREILTIPHQTIERLTAWIAIRGREPGPLFTSCDPARKGRGRLTASGVYRIVRRLGDEVGARARPHGLRHLAATTALAVTNGDVRAVMSFGRWENPRTALKYDDQFRDLGGQTARKVADALDDIDVALPMRDATTEPPRS